MKNKYQNQSINQKHVGLNMVFCFWETLETLKKFKLQKSAVSLIAYMTSSTSCKPYFKKLKIMIVTCMYVCEILLYNTCI
jgi:hypothetical protein